MTSFSVGYLAQRFVIRVLQFFHHWYIDGSRRFFSLAKEIIASLEQTFAVGLTLQHFSEPLYQDYSIVGRIIAPFFRIGRAALGAGLYLIVGVIFFVLYVSWLILPAALLSQSLIPLFMRS